MRRHSNMIGGRKGCIRPAKKATSLALLVLASAMASVLAADSTYIPWGYQTGVLPYTPPSSPNRPPEANNDDTYAGDLFYSPTTNLLYITGGTYSGSNFDAAEAGQDSQFHLPASDCYVAAIRFPSPGDSSTIDDAKQQQGSSSVPGYTDSAIGGGKDGELMFTARYGATEVPDVCSAIVPIRLGTAPTTPGTPAAATNSDHMVAIGHTEEGGLMTNLRSMGSDRSTVYGYALDLEVVQYSSGNGKQLTYSPKGVKHVGGRLFHENRVQYPVAVATPPPAAKVGNGYGDKSEVYVVMLISDYDDITNRWDPKARNPDLTAGGGGGVQKYGRGGYSIEIKKLGWKFEYGPPGAATQDQPTAEQEVTENMVTVFTQEYATSDMKSVRVANLLYIPHVNAQGQREDFLLMAGHTRGYGWAFGSDTPSGTDDSDGFVTKLDPNTGLEMSKSANMDATDMTFSNTYSMRLSTQPGKSEIIHAVCVNRNDDDVRSAYIVGSTTGLIDPNFTPPANAKGKDVQFAFIAKLDLDTLNIEWRKQYGTFEGTDAYATGCAVTDNGAVYVGGVVTDDGVLTGDDLDIVHGVGGDDVFLIRMYEANGKVMWGRQIGTDQDERLATGGGVEHDGDENAILFGTTRGSMMRMRADDSPNAAPGTANPADVFVMSVSQDGHHRFPIEEVTGVGTGSGSTGGSVSPGSNDPKFPNQPSGNQDPVKGSAANSSSEPSGASKFLIAIIGLSGATLLIFFAYKVGTRRSHDSYNNSKDNRHITQYLKDFDDMDVAIRPSATGGWHGMYDLGGKGSSELGGSPSRIPEEVSFGLGSGEASGETASLGKESVSSGSGSVNSDIVKESLFFDEEEEAKPKKRGSDGLFQIDDDEEDGGEGKKWGAGYAGLVESYNESWKERSPQSLGMGGFGKNGLPADSAPRISGSKNKDKPTDAEIV